MGVEDIPIQDILGKIERGEIALPDIQREFVWKNTQVKDLIESIYKKDPIGLILLWEQPYGENIPTVFMEEYKGENRKYKELIIDGQQRLTSLLLVHKGKLTRYGKPKEIKLFFNSIDEEFQLENPKIRNKPQWFNVTRVINEPLTRIIDKDRLKNEFGLSDNDIEKKVYSRLEDLKSQLNKERLPVFRIPSNKSYEEIAKIFVNVNSKGTRIRITELLLALLAIKIPGKFKKGLYEYISDLEDNNWDLDVSIIIRSLVGIATKQGRLQYFRSIAEKIKEDNLEGYWINTKNSLDHLIKILFENLGIRDSSLLPSSSILIPLVSYLNKKNGRLSTTETNRLMLWFLLGSFWGRYTVSLDSTLDEDIKSIVNTGKLTELFRALKSQRGRLKIKADDFVGTGTDKKLLLYVVSRDAGAIDWFKGVKITTSDIQEHHIFPKSLVKDYYDTELINDIANIAFLTEKANKSISNKEPIQYIKEYNIDEEKLKNQYIPLDKGLLKIMNFEKFIEIRRNLIVNAVNEYLGKLGLAEESGD